MRMLVKIGGRVIRDDAGYASLARSLRDAGDGEFIVVHGGGAEITRALEAAGSGTRFVDGLRVTTEKDIALIEQVLWSINGRIARFLEENGLPAARMSGKTGNLIRTEPMIRNGESLGRVGRITDVHPEPVLEALGEGRIPVISPVSGDGAGESVNVNADSAAAEIAMAASCTDLVYLTDVPGIRAGGEVLSDLTTDRARALIGEGVVKEGMVAKLESAFRVLENTDGRVIITMWQGDTTLGDIVENRLNQGTIIRC